MNFKDYENAVLPLAEYPDIGNNLIYPALGLVGESGEVADKIKKLWRNKGITKASQLEFKDSVELIKELGDSLWYLASLANELRVDLEYVAELNIIKLRDRHTRGVIKSEGDNR